MLAPGVGQIWGGNPPPREREKERERERRGRDGEEGKTRGHPSAAPVAIRRYVKRAVPTLQYASGFGSGPLAKLHSVCAGENSTYQMSIVCRRITDGLVVENKACRSD